MSSESDIEISAVAGGALRVLNGNGQLAEVYTLSGSLILTQAIASDDYSITAELPAGVYVVRVNTTSRKVRL